MFKRASVAVMGSEVRPRRVLRGLAAGSRIVVSPEEHLGYLFGVSEGHLQRAIRTYVKRGDRVYDIGANIGYVSLSLSARVGAGGRVYAFEPLPVNLDRLRQAIGDSGKTNVTILECAASDAAGTTVIRTTGNHSMASMVWHKDNPAAEEFTIRTERIDDLVRSGQLAEPSFVKIDVEGAEGKVLAGMRETLTESRPVLFVECSDAGREIAWTMLKGFGYRCESAITRKQIERFEEYRHGDFLWLP